MNLNFIKGLPENLALSVNTIQGNFLVSYKEGIDKELAGKVDTIFLTSQNEPFFEYIRNAVPRQFSSKVKIMVPKGGDKIKWAHLESTSNVVEEFPLDENFKIPGTNIICKGFRLSGTNIGLKFEGIVYLPSEPVNIGQQKYLYSTRSIVFDFPTTKAIELSLKYRPDLAILTDQKIPTQEINRKWVKELSGYRGTSFITATTTEPLEIYRDFTQRLCETKKAFSVPSTKCASIILNEVSLILHHKLLRDVANKLTYLTDDFNCYGIIKMGTPYKINIADFESLKDKHHVTDEELVSWWPNKEVLFAYPFELIESFNKPVKVQWNENYEVEKFLGEVEDKIPTQKINDEKNIVPPANSLYTELADFEKEIKFTSSPEEILSFTDDSKKYSVEKLYGGIPVRVSKINNTVSIMNRNGKNVTHQHSQIALELFCLTGKNFILEGEIVGNILYCSECLMVGDYNLTDSEWHERKSQLHSLSYTKNIKEAESTVVVGKRGIEQMLSIIRNIPSFKYASIKDYEDIYVDNKYSVWTIFESVKNEGVSGATTTSSPGIAGIQGHIYPKKKKIISPTDQYPPDPFNFSSKTDLSFIGEELSDSNVVNHDFFDTWSDAMAYYLGLLSTDGNVDLTTNRIEFFIHPQDKHILEEFATLLGDKIGPKEISGYTAYRFKSKQMVDKLRELGFEDKKPTRKTHSYVPEKWKWSFLRGAFDADGSVNEDRVQFDSGNRVLVEWVANLFEQVIPGEVKLYNYDSVDKIVVLGESAQKIHDKIYSGSGPKFKRKADKKIQLPKK